MYVLNVYVCRAVTRPVLILLPVLGLTWLCGVLVHLSVVVAYVFIALNAFQVNADTISKSHAFYNLDNGVVFGVTIMQYQVVDKVHEPFSR